MEISPEEEERLYQERELRKEIARKELEKFSKPTFKSVSIVLIFWGLDIMAALIFHGIIEIGGKPCEQYTVEEQFIACMESISNRY